MTESAFPVIIIIIIIIWFTFEKNPYFGFVYTANMFFFSTAYKHKLHSVHPSFDELEQ